MSVLLPLSKKRYATIISVYAPTMTNSDNVKEKFYEDLKSTIETTLKSDKLIILETSMQGLVLTEEPGKVVLGRHGIGKCNSNGLHLLQTCALLKLLITNTVFQLPYRNRTSWM